MNQYTPEIHAMTAAETSDHTCGINTESYTAFSGTKLCVKEVSRKSEKAAKIADSMAATQEKALVSYVCEKNGLTLPECYNGEEAAV